MLKDILEYVGDTPVVKLNKVSNELSCELYDILTQVMM